MDIYIRGNRIYIIGLDKLLNRIINKNSNDNKFEGKRK